jgi:hypothetical protein
MSRQSTGAVTSGDSWAGVGVVYSTKFTMWRELELRWGRQRRWLLAWWNKRRSGNCRLAGAGQPEGRGRFWGMTRRMHLVWK